MSFSSVNESIGRQRWTICALIFAATTINYLDRNVLGLLKPVLTAHGVFGEDKAQELNYSRVVICFQFAYAAGLLFAGKLIDKVGTKKGYAWALIGWSFAAIGHAFGQHTWSFGFWRAALGITEAGNFPAANKAIAEWFPKKERAFATGLYNSGANVGAIVAPLTVPYIASAWGWEWAFILTGVIGFTWLAFWYPLYASPAAKLQSGKLSQPEYDFIHSDVDEQEAERADVAKVKVSWFKLLTFRQTWAFVVGKFLTDPIWWFFLFWLPSFLNGENARKVKEFMTAFPTDVNTLKVNEYLAAHPNYTGDLSKIAGVEFPGVISWQFAVAIVYCISTVGSISGGWLPKKLINGGMDANQARKTAMFVIALFPLTVLLASRLGAINTWYAVLTIAIATAAHQAWSANIFTTVSDMFPKKVVASVTGIGGMAGSVGGILIAYLAGLMLQHYKNLGKIEVGYGIMFVICGLAYITAWTLMHLLVPKFKNINLSDDWKPVASENTPKDSTTSKKSNPFTLIILCALLALAGYAYYRHTSDLSAVAEQALRRQIESESGNQINLNSFMKTDGQKSEIFKVQVYKMDYEAEIVFQTDGIWLGKDIMNHSHDGLTFSFRPGQSSGNAFEQLNNWA